MKRAEASLLGPHDWLIRASRAPDAERRAKYATHGLRKVGSDTALQALLLRQLYLANLETGQLDRALAVATELVSLQTLADAAYQDLARVQLATGEHASALATLECAWQVAPEGRKSFHDWTRGCIFYLLGDLAAAVAAFQRAVSLGTRAPELLETQLRLARFATEQQQQTPDDSVARMLLDACASLEKSTAMSGYGAFVAGESRFGLGDTERATEHLRGFVARIGAASGAQRVTLALEFSRAQRRLDALGSRS